MISPAELRKLVEFRKLNFTTIFQATLEESYFLREESYFLGWLNVIEARRESNSEVHLLTGFPKSPPQGVASIQQWLLSHPHFQMHYAPLVIDLSWFNLVQTRSEMLCDLCHTASTGRVG